MKTWSGHPFAPTVAASDVAAIASIVAEHRGESSIIYEIGGYPGWLVKRYKTAPSDRRQGELDELIRLPGTMSGEDRRLVDETIAWPVARIVDGSITQGVIIAKAPEHFFHNLTLIEGRQKRVAISIDHLVMTGDYYRQRGLPSPGLADRLAVVREIVAVGELLERNRLVYGDWSYANAFWSPTTHQSFVIDADSCGFGGRPWVESNAWDDPLVEHGVTLTAYSDRYKLILLTARCLTGTRAKDASMLAALPPSLRNGSLERLLEQGLTARTLTARPSLPALLRALDQAIGASADLDWIPISRSQQDAAGAPSRQRQTADASAAIDAQSSTAYEDWSQHFGSQLPDSAANVAGWRSVGREPEPSQGAVSPARATTPSVSGQGRHRRVSAKAVAIAAVIIAILVVLALVIRIFG